MAAGRVEAKRTASSASQNAAFEIPKIKALLKQSYNQNYKDQELLSGLDPQPLLNQQQIDALNRLKEESSNAITAARKLIHFPHGRYPVTWSPDWISTLLLCPDNRIVVNLLKQDALHLAQQGDADGALHHARGVSLRFLDRRRADKHLATHSHRLPSCRLEYAGTCVRRGSEPSEATLEAFQKRLEQVDKEPLLLYSFRGERAGEYHLLEWLKQGNSTAGLNGGGMAKGFDALSLYFA